MDKLLHYDIIKIFLRCEFQHLKNHPYEGQKEIWKCSKWQRLWDFFKIEKRGSNNTWDALLFTWVSSTVLEIGKKKDFGHITGT